MVAQFSTFIRLERIFSRGLKVNCVCYVGAHYGEMNEAQIKSYWTVGYILNSMLCMIYAVHRIFGYRHRFFLFDNVGICAV